MNAAGHDLAYSVLFGGSAVGAYDQFASAIALDTSNEAYIAGETNASDFPTKGDPSQPTCPNNCNATQGFVTKFTCDGKDLTYSSFLGGDTGNATEALGIAVDQVGDAYLTGQTETIDFPVTPAPFNLLTAGVTAMLS